ncbi:hypothetical protein ACOME3_008158 [Neoechinorhynchus agilis]
MCPASKDVEDLSKLLFDPAHYLALVKVEKMTPQTEVKKSENVQQVVSASSLKNPEMYKVLIGKSDKSNSHKIDKVNSNTTITTNTSPPKPLTIQQRRLCCSAGISSSAAAAAAAVAATAVTTSSITGGVISYSTFNGTPPLISTTDQKSLKSVNTPLSSTTDNRQKTKSKRKTTKSSSLITESQLNAKNTSEEQRSSLQIQSQPNNNTSNGKKRRNKKNKRKKSLKTEVESSKESSSIINDHDDVETCNSDVASIPEVDEISIKEEEEKHEFAVCEGTPGANENNASETSSDDLPKDAAILKLMRSRWTEIEQQIQKGDVFFA